MSHTRRDDLTLALALVVTLAVVGLSMLAGARIRGAGDVCVSAPVGPGGTIATWCGDDVPLPNQTF